MMDMSEGDKVNLVVQSKGRAQLALNEGEPDYGQVHATLALVEAVREQTAQLKRIADALTTITRDGTELSVASLLDAISRKSQYD